MDNSDRVYSVLESLCCPSKLIYDVQTKKSQPSTDLYPEEQVGMFSKLMDLRNAILPAEDCVFKDSRNLVFFNIILGRDHSFLP